MSSLWNSSFVYPCCSLRGVYDLALGCGWQISAFPSASFSSLCLGHSGVLTFLWLFEPKERIGCSARFLGIIFLCVATLCKIARSRVLLTCTWTAGSLCSDLQAYSSPTNATSTLPQHKGQCMTSDQRTTSGFPSNFLPWDGWPNHFLIHTYIPLLLAQHLKWKFNNLMLGLLCLIRMVSCSLGESIKLIRKEYYLLIQVSWWFRKAQFYWVFTTSQ